MLKDQVKKWSFGQRVQIRKELGILMSQRAEYRSEMQKLRGEGKVNEAEMLTQNLFGGDEEIIAIYITNTCRIDRKALDDIDLDEVHETVQKIIEVNHLDGEDREKKAVSALLQTKPEPKS